MKQTSNKAVIIAEHDSHLQPHPSTLHEQSCNHTLRTFSELKIPLSTSTSTSNFLQLQPNMPGPSTGPSRGGLSGLLVDGATCWFCGVLPWGVGEQNTNVTTSGEALRSHGKKNNSVDLLIEFRTSGHQGLNWARHSGVSSVSHDPLSHTSGHDHCGWTEWLSWKTEQQGSDLLGDVGNSLFTTFS